MLPSAWAGFSAPCLLAPPSAPVPAALKSLWGMRRFRTSQHVRIGSGGHSLTAPDWRRAFRRKAIESRGAPHSRASTTGQREDPERWRALSLPEKLLQPVQLAVAIWLLLLLPAGLASSPRKLCGGFALGSLPFEYLIFFSVGTLPRAWKYGRYAKPPDSSAKPGTRRSDFVLFLLCVLIAHATAAFRFVSVHQTQPWDRSLGWVFSYHTDQSRINSALPPSLPPSSLSLSLSLYLSLYCIQIFIDTCIHIYIYIHMFKYRYNTCVYVYIICLYASW